MIYTIKKTNNQDKDFINLVKKLDAFLKITDGDEHAFYNQFNGIDVLPHVLVCYCNNIPVGCGAIKKFDSESMEVKRMFVEEDYRGTNAAATILHSLENWAKEIGYQNCILETGKRQVAAVKFYQKMGYEIIPNYGQYKQMENSVCFKKELVWV